jgi:hypothetical protein
MHPLLIIYDSISRAQSLGHTLKEKEQIMVAESSNKPEITGKFSDMLLLNSSELSRSELEELYTAKTERITKELWRLKIQVK